MLYILINTLLIIPLFLLGVIPGLKKLFQVLTLIVCKLLGITTKVASEGYQSIKPNKEFRELTGVKQVKRSKTNIKKKSSIHIPALIALIACGILFILNLQMLTDYLVVRQILPLINWFPLVSNVQDANTFFTAILFTIITYSLTTMWNRWKVTKGQRKENKIEKAKKLVLSEVSTKEIIEEVHKKERATKDNILGDN